MTISNERRVERLTLRAQGLPPNTELDFFVIQVPNAPFGLSWYQGDFETDDHGRGQQDYVGRFNVETFIVAPGTASAPVDAVTPFNGDHNAGVQVLSTRNFADDQGPLRQLEP